MSISFKEFSRNQFQGTTKKDLIRYIFDEWKDEALETILDEYNHSSLDNNGCVQTYV